MRIMTKAGKASVYLVAGHVGGEEDLALPSKVLYVNDVGSKFVRKDGKYVMVVKAEDRKKVRGCSYISNGVVV